MAYPHAIRLRGPWQCQPLLRVGGGSLPPPSRVFPPCTWGTVCGSDFFGTVRFTRAFHPPSALDSHERVWLTVEGADARGEVTLNGRYLGGVDGYAVPASWDVTELLKAQNELKIDVECLDDASGMGRLGHEHRPGGITGEVRLEIRSSSFVEDLAVWAVLAPSSGVPVLAVSGTVIGGTVGSQALVVNGLGRELLYAEATAGERFEFEASVPDMPVWPFRAAQVLAIGAIEIAELEIKLISGASAAWQTRVRTAAAPTIRDLQNGGLSDSGQTIPWPTIVVEPPDGFDQREASLRRSIEGASLVGIRGAADEPVYEWFDRSATAIIQILPTEWLDCVGPRLAHHPSIVAWGLDGKTAPGERQLATAFGRPVTYRPATRKKDV